MSGFTYTDIKASTFNLGRNKRISELISKDPAGDQSPANTEMIGDYTVGGEGEKIFSYTSAPDELHIITRLIIQVADAGQLAFDKFGKNTTLTTGVFAVQGTTNPPIEENVGPIIKVNTDWARYMSDVKVITFDAGKSQMYISWDLIGQGLPAVLDGDLGAFFGIKLTEDLSDINSFTMFVHGMRISKKGL